MRILEALERESLIHQVCISPHGHVTCSTCSWREHWSAIYDLQEVGILDAVEELHRIWRAYIGSSFPQGLQREYCFRYFVLIDTILEAAGAGLNASAFRRALRSALSFECFSIRASHILGGHAAGTSTQRNPVYLLGKLREPDALDDPQFLPLVTISAPKSDELFYHYRRHRLSPDSKNSLLLYLCTSQSSRWKSFGALNELERWISDARDPRANERARRVANGVIAPYLLGIMSSKRALSGPLLEFELVDIGAGSGSLAAGVCAQVCRFAHVHSLEPTVRVWMVDLSLVEPARFFGGKALLGHVDCVAAVGCDYRDWLGESEHLPPSRGIRVGLASRFFNNLSDFDIHPIPLEGLLPPGDRGVDEFHIDDCLPHRCLERAGGRPESLIASTSRIWTKSGRSFRQLSLSDYFHGLWLLENPRARVSRNQKEAWLPMRRFRTDLLLTGDGRSVLDQLLRNCNIAVIQDADMRAEDLIEHRNGKHLKNTAAVDMTRALRLKGHHVLVVGRPNDSGLVALKGKRLW